jgi:acyl carrier protein
MADDDEILEHTLGVVRRVAGKKGKSVAVDKDTSLLHGGLLDSVATLKVVDQLESKYGIEFDPAELSAEFLDTPAHIAKLIRKKLGKQ